MKFRIYLSKNNEPVPFIYPHRLCSIFHHWLGPNDLHGMMSLYSLGWLKGGRFSRNGLNFEEGATWDIGIHNNDIAERLIRGLLLKDLEFYGMKIRKVMRLDPPPFENDNHRFLAGSPVMLRKVEDDGSRTHVTFQDKDSSRILNRVIHKKAQEAKLDSANALDLQFDRNFKNAKTKLVEIKGIRNRASACPVIAKGSPEALEFLWTVGAGEMTGVGFGSLNHTHNGKSVT